MPDAETERIVFGDTYIKICIPNLAPMQAGARNRTRQVRLDIKIDLFADLSEEERSSYVLQDFGTAMRQADECDVLANQIYVCE